jgi:outer membrane immunogenic protein
MNRALRPVGEIPLVKKFVSTTIAAVVLCAAPAFAADMPAKAPVYKAPPAPLWSWTGFYAGVYAGVGLNRSHGFDSTGTFPGEIEYLGTGFTGGGTVGYNWQFDPHWVAGIEGDLGWLGLSHDSLQYNDGFNLNSKTSWLGTVRGRFGYTSGPTLTYLTGGAAFVHVDDSITSAGTTSDSAKTKTGFAVGSGVETRLGGNWTFKSESLYVDVGSGEFQSIGGFPLVEADKHRYLIQRFGVNYLFGAPPAGALPQTNWQGFFVGAVAGSAATQTRVSSLTAATPGEFGNTGTGFTAGIIAGYNWQFAPQWVAGVEGDFSWLGIDHTVNDYDDTFANYNLKTHWLATARGRLGYSTGPALLYVTGGGAWVNYEESWHSPNSNPALATVTSSKTLSGYAAGAGIEVPFTFFGLLGPGLLARSEYLYVNVGNGDTLSHAGFPVVANHQFHLFRGAVVYHFGG